MNLYEQLIVVRERLEGIGAHDDSMDLVETLLKRAEPAKTDKTNISQVQVLRHMLRMREVSDNYNIYNDLQELLSERDEFETLLTKMQPLQHMSTPNAIQNQNHSIRRRKKEKKRKVS